MVNDKIAVVTGSSSGIGLVTTLELALNGYRVIATMRDLGRAGRLEDAAQKAGVGERLGLRRIDITEIDSLPETIAAIRRDHGRIDLLVNNAGFGTGGFSEDMSLAELRRQMETNFFGNVAMTKAVLPVMREQRSGHIIQITSVAGRMAAPLLGAYAASKFALEGWSEALRIEVHSLGIRVALVEPGDYDTDIWDRNVKIAEQALDPNSPNRQRSERFVEFVKSRAPKRRDPREVARLIVRIARHPNPKLRYLIGPDAKTSLVFRALLPWRRYERMVAKVTRIG
ncbi:MAG TPA: SDR family oxidoreductase [Terriglobales bacterium]|nr:SDR family oxidoreductase [Terriglobales bacterium]